MGSSRREWRTKRLLAVMEPTIWATMIVDYLERAGIVGTLLPRSAGDADDRYQPSRVSAIYFRGGSHPPRSQITFKIKAPEDREDFSEEQDEWAVVTRPDVDGWGEDWEVVTI